MSLPDILTMDRRSCAVLNRASDHDPVRWFFAGISRLGDGVFWYTLMAILPVLYGSQALATTLHMAAIGLAALSVYRWIKARTTRLRPFMVDSRIQARARVLDHYSFPSGHTLQAVAFTTVACAWYPELGWVLWPFTALVAVSRPVLGLHYPSDVVMGAVIGWALASASLGLVT